MMHRNFKGRARKGSAWSRASAGTEASNVRARARSRSKSMASWVGKKLVPSSNKKKSKSANSSPAAERARCSFFEVPNDDESQNPRLSVSCSVASLAEDLNAFACRNSLAKSKDSSGNLSMPSANGTNEPVKVKKMTRLYKLRMEARKKRKQKKSQPDKTGIDIDDILVQQNGVDESLADLAEMESSMPTSSRVRESLAEAKRASCEDLAEKLHMTLRLHQQSDDQVDGNSEDNTDTLPPGVEKDL